MGVSLEGCLMLVHSALAGLGVRRVVQRDASWFKDHDAPQQQPQQSSMLKGNFFSKQQPSMQKAAATLYYCTMFLAPWQLLSCMLLTRMCNGSSSGQMVR